jgi:hypothetical protein
MNTTRGNKENSIGVRGQRVNYNWRIREGFMGDLNGSGSERMSDADMWGCSRKRISMPAGGNSIGIGRLIEGGRDE